MARQRPPQPQPLTRGTSVAHSTLLEILADLKADLAGPVRAGSEREDRVKARLHELERCLRDIGTVIGLDE